MRNCGPTSSIALATPLLTLSCNSDDNKLAYILDREAMLQRLCVCGLRKTRSSKYLTLLMIVAMNSDVKVSYGTHSKPSCSPSLRIGNSNSKLLPKLLGKKSRGTRTSSKKFQEVLDVCGQNMPQTIHKLTAVQDCPLDDKHGRVEP